VTPSDAFRKYVMELEGNVRFWKTFAVILSILTLLDLVTFHWS
jgi:hypothetical protein